MTRSTRTYVLCQVSTATYLELTARLQEAGYGHAFLTQSDGRTVIDMHGIALVERSAVAPSAGEVPAFDVGEGNTSDL